MAQKLYQLFCEMCSWKKLTDGTDVNLVEVITAPIPGGSPKKDPITNEIILPKSKNQPKKYKCPNCGRIIIPKKINNPQEELDNKLELEDKIKERMQKEKQETEIQRNKCKSIMEEPTT
jgi:hypothetical protein